jgi:hypothetical protein
VEDWKSSVVGVKEDWCDAQRVIRGVSRPKHPLISSYGAYAGTNLVGEGLKTKTTVCGGEAAGNGFLSAGLLLYHKKPLDGFFEPTVQQIIISFKWKKSPVSDAGLRRNMEAMDCIQEEKGSNLLVQVSVGMAKLFERVTFMKKFGE